MSELYHWLNHAAVFKSQNTQWADSYQHIFFVEEILQQAGLSQNLAHRLVKTQAWVFQIQPVTLQVAVETFVKLGYEEDVIWSIANRMPHLFHLLPQHITEECKNATSRQRGLLWNARLQAYEPPKQMTPRFTRSVEPKRKKSVPAPRTKIKDGQSAVAEPEPVYKPEPKVEQYNGPKSEPRANRADVQPTKNVPTKMLEPYPRTLKPLRLFNPLRENPDTAQVAAGEEIDAQAGVIEKDSSDADDEQRGANEWSLPPSSVAPVETVGHSAPNDDGSRLHLDKIEAFVRSELEDDDVDVWKKYLEVNPWLKQPKSVEYQACAVLLRWIMLQSIGSASSYKDDTDAGLRFRFWRKVLLSPKYRGILQIFPEVLERRLYVLRRIDRCPMKGPSWIMKPWETLEDAELRFRLNEIDAHGKNPKFKPYINMLLEPTRESFKKRLQRYLKLKDKKNDLFFELEEEGIIMDDESEPVKYITRTELIARLARARKNNKP